MEELLEEDKSLENQQEEPAQSFETESEADEQSIESAREVESEEIDPSEILSELSEKVQSSDEIVKEEEIKPDGDIGESVESEVSTEKIEAISSEIEKPEETTEKTEIETTEKKTPTKPELIEKANKALWDHDEAKITGAALFDYNSETGELGVYSAVVKLKRVNGDCKISQILIGEDGNVKSISEELQLEDPIILLGDWCKVEEIDLKFEGSPGSYELSGKGEFKLEKTLEKGETDNVKCTINKEGLEVEVEDLTVVTPKFNYEMDPMSFENDVLTTDVAKVTTGITKLEDDEEAELELKLDEGALQYVDFASAQVRGVKIDKDGLSYDKFIPFTPVISYENEDLGVKASLDFAKRQGSVEGEWEFPGEIPGIWPFELGIDVPAVPGVYVFGNLSIGGGMKLNVGAALKYEKDYWKASGEIGASADIAARATIGVGLGSKYILALEGGLFAEIAASAAAKGNIEGKFQYKDKKVSAKEPVEFGYNAGAELKGSVGGVITARAFYVFKKDLYQVKIKEWNLGKFIMEGKAVKGEDGKYHHEDKRWKFTSDFAQQPEFADPFSSLDSPEANDLMLQDVDITDGGEARLKYLSSVKGLQQNNINFLVKMTDFACSDKNVKLLKRIDNMKTERDKLEKEIQTDEQNVKNGKASFSSKAKGFFTGKKGVEVEKQKIEGKKLLLKKKAQSYTDIKSSHDDLIDEINNSIDLLDATTAVIKSIEKLEGKSPDALDKGETIKPHIDIIKSGLGKENEFKKKRDIMKKHLDIF